MKLADNVNCPVTQCISCTVLKINQEEGFSHNLRRYQ